MGTLSEKEVEVLLKDWFNRDGETFTKVTSKGRIGWEATLEEGDSYSAYFLEAPTKKDLISRAHTLAKEIIVVMDPPMKVAVRLSSRDSYTEGKSVVVATEMFDIEDLTVGERLDTFLGCAVHEGCHLLWTDFDIFRREVAACSKPHARIISTLFNILEDERIETICGEEKPGLARFLEKTKYFYFDYKFVEEYKADRELNLFEKVFSTIFRIIRYPRYLNIEDIEFFGDRLFKVKELLTPYPHDTKDTFDTAGKIFEVIKDLYEEKTEEEEAKKAAGGFGGEGEGEGEEGEGGSITVVVGSSGSDDKSGKGEEGSKPLSKKEIEEKMEKESEKILTVLEKVLSRGSEKAYSPEGDESVSVRGDRDFMDSLTGEIIKGVGRETYYTKPKSNKEVYMASLQRVIRYVPSIRKVIQGHCKEYKLVHKSMRSGVLDTTKLAEAYQGVPTVYIREGEVKTDRVAVVVLIDESGSMGGDKITAARDAAILLNESLSGIPNVDLFIYGHTGDVRSGRSTDLHIYREKLSAMDKYALGGVRAVRENRDGTAIFEVAKRVRRQTSEHCLFFILSDGAPQASGYSGGSAMEDVRKNVELVERMGFYVIQICIQKGYNPAAMFKHYLFMDNISTLALDLGRAIKQATLRNTKTHIT